MVLVNEAGCVCVDVREVRLTRAANCRTVIPGAILGLAIGYGSRSRKAGL